MPGDLLTAVEVGEILGKSPSYVRTLLALKEDFPQPTKYGHTNLWKRSDVLAYDKATKGLDGRRR